MCFSKGRGPMRKAERCKWFVVGFTFDDIVVSWRGSELGRALLDAWRTTGCPAGVEILQTSGESEYLIYWFLSQGAVRLLNDRDIEWRTFFLGECAQPPDGALNVFEEEAGGIDADARNEQ